MFSVHILDYLGNHFLWFWLSNKKLTKPVSSLKTCYLSQNKIEVQLANVKSRDRIHNP